MVEKKILIGAMIFVIGVAIYFFGSRFIPIRCIVLHKMIENEFDKANFCEQDSDCKGMQLGGSYVEFGCYKFVNKKINEKEIYSKLDKYAKQCMQKIDECGRSPKLICVNKKCVSSPK